MNRESGERVGAENVEPGSERAFECAFTTLPELVEQFAAIERIEGFRRQLPVGVFDGAISNSSRWSPGGASQIDLWAVASDGLTIHLFELKKPDNIKLGILPEAFWYARLLHRIRERNFGGLPVSGGGPHMETVRNAKRIKMWLLARVCIRSWSMRAGRHSNVSARRLPERDSISESFPSNSKATGSDCAPSVGGRRAREPDSDARSAGGVVPVDRAIPNPELG